MNIKKYLYAAAFVFAVAIFSTVSVSAQEMSDKKMMKDDRPIVAVVKADWCPYCKRVEPVMMKLMEEYGEKLNFVVFDVTNEDSSAKAKEKAEMLGLEDLFEKIKSKTSSVVLLKNKEIVYKTSNNNKREDYVKAFDKALK